jgi:uncharacterized protein
MISDRIHVDHGELSEFCRKNHVRRLSVFGSVLTERFTEASDIDILAEFEPDHLIGFLGMASMERELSVLFGGRRVDLRTPAELSPHFRDEVLKTASLQYAS